MPPFTRLVIPEEICSELNAHARESAPLECCGLLAGRIVDGVGAVSVCYPIENVVRSPTEYETDAREMMFAFRAMRERGIELLAIYHSHPASAPVPSRRDIERNTYGETAAHVIVGLAGAEAEVRAWWLTETGFREAELHVARI